MSCIDGELMKLILKNAKQALLFISLLLLSVSCKQSEFYDKSAVLDTIKKSIETPSNQNDNTQNPTTSDGSVDPKPPITQGPISTPTPAPAPTPTPDLTLKDKVEIFSQNNQKDGDVDILWVIDDSGSMADNQDALARNFNTFINQFITKNINFKMAITTTDGTTNRNGRMVGDSSLLTSEAAKANKSMFLGNFARWVKVGTTGSGIEQGLKCASSFLDRYESSFLRKDALLAVVFLSDENDQSEKTVSEYINRLQSAKSSKGLVKTYSIVTQTLPKNAQWESIGARYNQVSDATAGIKSEITGDFAQTLSEISGHIVNLIDSFALSETPYNNLIEVYVNNSKIISGWTFDNASRSIKFNAGQIPSEGSKIEIHYKVKSNVLGAI